MTMVVGIGTSIIAPPMMDVLATRISTPPKVNVSSISQPAQHLLGCARDATYAERDHIIYFEASFLGSYHVTSTRTLPVMFLIDDDHVPIKLEKITGI